MRPADISMNTTDVLERAYPSVVALRQSSQPSPEQRYGGPIRSTEEMFNYYTNFYQRTPLLSAPVSNVNSHLVKVGVSITSCFYVIFIVKKFR